MPVLSLVLAAGMLVADVSSPAPAASDILSPAEATADGLGDVAGVPVWGLLTTLTGAPAEASLAPAPGVPSVPTPVDGGLMLLAAAGAGYTARRLRARRA